MNDFKGPGFDWNGNGRKDVFDVATDMYVIDEVNKNKEDCLHTNYKRPSTREVSDEEWAMFPRILAANLILWPTLFIAINAEDSFLAQFLLPVVAIAAALFIILKK